MPHDDLIGAIQDVLTVDVDGFQRRVRNDADVIIEEIEAGTFDNPQAIVGLEYEFYAVREDCSLARVPRRLLAFVGFEKELGLHNAEMTTSPQPLNEHGLVAQEAEVKARLSAAMEPMDAEGLHFASDGMWTIPPEGETAREYLTDFVETDGIRLATNMSSSSRYHAMGNTDQPVGMQIDAPHVTLSGKTVMPEALITSIQPHYQVPHAVDLPTYFRYAIRVAAPLLALSVNSPFFPPDLYDADVEAADILRDGWDESRISVFESVLNVPGTQGKVRFPDDIDSVVDAVEQIVEDDVVVPMEVTPQGRFDDEFATFRMKHGTYWRWVRPVFGGSSRGNANARIEFRPIAAQPTIRDSMAFQAAFAGLLEQCVTTEHPVHSLDWEIAEQNFYDAAKMGIGADLAWVTADAEVTHDFETIFADVLDAATTGLQRRGLSKEQAAKYIYPLRQRARHEVTPADWKRDRVRDHLDENRNLEDAIYEMQYEYLQNQQETLLDGSFADWVGRGQNLEN